MGYAIDYEPDGAVVHFSGRLTYEDVAGSNDELWNAAEWPTMRYQIGVLLNVSEVAISSTDSIEFAFMDNAAGRTNGHMRIAVVATDPAIVVKALSYISLLDAPGWEGKLFPTVVAARRWACELPCEKSVSVPAMEVGLDVTRFRAT